MTDAPIIIDGLQYCAWSEAIFRQMRAGGVTAVHATICYHEGFRETVANIIRFNRWFERHPDLIMPGRTGEDVRRAQATGRTAIVFGLQNCAPIEDDIGLVEICHTLGVRFMQLSYNNQSLLATGCYEAEDPGITRMGRQVIREMNRVGMVIDMSHSAERSTLEAIELSARPIAITHANPAAWHPARRNKSPAVLRALADSGGMLGFSLYPHHLRQGSDCTLDDFCAMIARTAEVMGVDRLGIGSDLCQDQPDSVVEWMRVGRWTREMEYGEGSAQNAGFPPQPAWFRDNLGLGTIRAGLRDAGFAAAEVDQIMGLNWLRFFDQSFGPRVVIAPKAQTTVPLRSPDQVMRLARLGCFHQTRLSFARAMLRRLQSERWRIERTVWRLDARAEGVAVYTARGPERAYSLVCFSHDLDPALRSDRVIAEAWDATFALVDGVPDEATIARLAENVPRQEAGRCGPGELVLSRANRSVRLFDHVAQCLAAGAQPDPKALASVGYLMRTTAVYGSGKFGLADRESIADRPELAGPFRAEMLTVWLIRAFTVDLVEHVAASRAPDRAVRLAPALRRMLGVGNATGLGMAPFLVNHPALLHRWILARETALARVRSLPATNADRLRAFARALDRARTEMANWMVEDAVQMPRILALRHDLAVLARHVEAGLPARAPWDALLRWAEDELGLEAQELLVTLLLEPHGDLVDALADDMGADEAAAFRIAGGMRLRALRGLIAARYDWALRIKFADRTTQARFWYVSEEKLEPRLGERFSEPGAEREQPLAIARDIADLHAALRGVDDDETVAAFLLRNPGHRHVVRRVQIAATRPYAEVRDNLLDAAMRPIDLLRCKLAFFGATRFDPKSDRWVRITLFQNAPYPDELAQAPFDDWMFASPNPTAACASP